MIYYQLVGVAVEEDQHGRLGAPRGEEHRGVALRGRGRQGLAGAEAAGGLAGGPHQDLRVAA